MNSTKSFNQVKRRFTDKFVLKTCFLVAKTLLFTIVMLNNGTSVVNAEPQALRSDIRIRKIISTFSTISPSVRIAKDPRNNTLYYLKRNGEIYQVNLALSTSTLVYNSSNHKLGETQGMAIGPDGTIYLVGNADLVNDQTKATIVKGVINSGTKERIWSVLATSAGYPKSKTAYDHRFNGVVVSPDGKFIYVNSGSRTDHGEVQSTGGLYPNTREVGLTACILRLPSNGQNLFLANNRATLKTAGYIFAEGTRNTFDMAFASNGDLFGTENGPDRDMSEELNWLRLGHNYGFPWRIGGTDNPQQFPNYNPLKDLLLNPKFTAVKKGYYYNDPSFPARPNITLTEPIRNLGPDADSFRDPQDGKVKDASVLGVTFSTFTAHRSPLGLIFETQGAMSPEFNRNGFVLGWTPGDPTGETLGGPFKDPSQDLLDLKLIKVGTTNYQLQAKRIVQGFSNPIDTEIIGNKIYVLEYGGIQGIWEISMPTK
ncbi:PQQ-dependent sugar dehydrogenase [Nostoc sp.]|uniref:PQQ-dependent sugar dehydrogenase n=1 Tax=Nostoc sp. TaxID=1180 RepID=UPI002FFA9717